MDRFLSAKICGHYPLFSQWPDGDILFSWFCTIWLMSGKVGPGRRFILSAWILFSFMFYTRCWEAKSLFVAVRFITYKLTKLEDYFFGYQIYQQKFQKYDDHARNLAATVGGVTTWVLYLYWLHKKKFYVALWRINLFF